MSTQDPQPPSAGNAEAEAESLVPRHKQKLVKSLAFGIGSAAIVAALLFAGRNRGKPGD